MDPLVEQLLATTGLSCEDLLAKLQQYRSEKSKSSPEENAVSNSDETNQTNQDNEQSTATGDQSVIIEANSSNVACSQTSDAQVTTQSEVEHPNEESSSTQTKSEDNTETQTSEECSTQTRTDDDNETQTSEECSTQTRTDDDNETQTSEECSEDDNKIQTSKGCSTPTITKGDNNETQTSEQCSVQTSTEDNNETQTSEECNTQTRTDDTNETQTSEECSIQTRTKDHNETQTGEECSTQTRTEDNNETQSREECSAQTRTEDNHETQTNEECSTQTRTENINENTTELNNEASEEIDQQIQSEEKLVDQQSALEPNVDDVCNLSSKVDENEEVQENITAHNAPIPVDNQASEEIDQQIQDEEKLVDQPSALEPDVDDVCNLSSKVDENEEVEQNIAGHNASIPIDNQYSEEIDEEKLVDQQSALEPNVDDVCNLSSKVDEKEEVEQNITAHNASIPIDNQASEEIDQQNQYEEKLVDQPSSLEPNVDDVCNLSSKVDENEELEQNITGHNASIPIDNQASEEIDEEKLVVQQSALEPNVDDVCNLSSKVDENEEVEQNITAHNASIPTSIAQKSSDEEVCTSSADIPSCSQFETSKEDSSEVVSTTSVDECVGGSTVKLEPERYKKKFESISSMILSKIQFCQTRENEDSSCSWSKKDDEIEQSTFDSCSNFDSNDTIKKELLEPAEEVNGRNEHNYSNFIGTNKQLNSENVKTPNASVSESQRETPPVDELPKSEENLRDILRLQLSSLRNMKKSNNYLTDIKNTSVSFQNLKKKRKSWDLNPLVPVAPNGSKDENEKRTVDESKHMFSSNESSIASLSEEPPFVILNVTGGVDHLTPETPNLEVENEEKRAFASVTNANEENISNNEEIVEAHATIQATDENKEQGSRTSDVNVTSTSGVLRISKQLFSRDYTMSNNSSEDDTPNISVNKNISTSFTYDPGVSKSAKNCEKSPFVSDSLDDFLNESAQLKISYAIPKLRAEEGIRETPNPSPYADIVKTPKVEQAVVVQKGPKLVKAKTLAEMRRQFEKLNRESGADEQPPEVLSHYKKKKKLFKQGSKLGASPSLKNSFIMYDNRKLRVYSKNKDKCVTTIYSKLNKENIHEPPPCPTPKQELTPTRRLSLLSSLTQNKPCPVKYKPGPLCKKASLQNAESRDRWTTELKLFPKVYMEVVPEVHHPIDRKLVHLLPIFDDTVISGERTNFALSVLKFKEATSQPETFTFHIPYINRQEHLLVRKLCKPVIRVEETENKETDPESEIKNILDDLITYVEIKEIANSVIKEEDLVVEPEEKPIETSPKCKTRKIKRKKLDLELRRLNCKVIDVATKEPEITNCTKPYCRLGCVCKSLNCEGIFSNHCQLVNCMFACTCRPSNSIEVTTENNFLSVHTVSHLEDKAKKNLAKEEREFTQTLIHTDNDAILVGTAKMRRSSKPPKKYTDYIGDDVIFDDIPPKKEVEVLKTKKCDLVLSKLELDDLIPYCLFHHLYDCHCKGLVVKYPIKRLKPVPQIPKIRIVRTKEDQHKAWYESCARIRTVFPEYKERNKNPVYNQKLRKTYSPGRKFFGKKQPPVADGETNITINHEISDGGVPIISKPNKRKQSFVIRQDILPKPTKEYALQRRKRKIRPKIDHTSFNSSMPSLSLDTINAEVPVFSASRAAPVSSTETDVSSGPEAVEHPTFNPIFEGEIKLCVKDNQEMLNIIGNEKKYLRILPWDKLIQNYRAGKIRIWAREHGPATVLCNSAGHLPPKHFTDIKNVSRRSDLIQWILKDDLPGISRELMHLLLTPKQNHFLIPGYCLKKPNEVTLCDKSHTQDPKDAERNTEQPKRPSLLTEPSSNTSPDEASSFVYKFSKPKVLETTKTIHHVDTEKLQSTLNRLESKRKKKQLVKNSHSDTTGSVSLLKKQLSHMSNRDDQNSTPTIQQVLNSHKLESESSVKTKRSSWITEDSEESETLSPTKDNVSVELLHLLDITSKKRRNNTSNGEEQDSTNTPKDPLDTTDIEILLDRSMKKRRRLSQNIEENRTKTVPSDPLEIPQAEWSEATAIDPLEPQEPVKNRSNDVHGFVGANDNQRDPLEIAEIDTVTVEKHQLKSSEKQLLKSPPAKTSLKQAVLTESSKKAGAKSRLISHCMIPSRSMKCTHKDKNNKSKTLILTNKVFMKRKLICSLDNVPEITVPLPTVAKNLRWRMIYLNSDFTFLMFVQPNYSIKYTDLLDVVKMSSSINSTITLRSKEFVNKYKHPLFGIFCVPDFQDRLFVGPFLSTERHSIETLRYLRGRLIDTGSFNRMVGKTTSDKKPIWLYESSPKAVSTSTTDVIDITEDDDANDIPVVNLDSDSSEEAQSIKLNSSDNNLLCPPFVEEIRLEELNSHSINRYIVTNIPHLGYFCGYQRDSKAIDVLWPGTSKGYRFPNVTFAKNLLTQYLTQIFCPIPQDFKINVIIMTNIGIQSNKPIDPKYFSNSGVYFCGEFGICEKNNLPRELLKENNVRSVDNLLKLHREAKDEDDSLIRLFGLFLMSNEELRKHAEPNNILKWAISEIYIQKKLCENYESEKADLQSIIRKNAEENKLKRKRMLQTDDLKRVQRPRIEIASRSNTETIEIKDSDEEESPDQGTSSAVFRKIASSGKVVSDAGYGTNNEGRSLLKSNLWMQKRRSVLKTNSTTGQVIQGSPDTSALIQPVTISINNSNIVLNKNNFLVTKLK